MFVHLRQDARKRTLFAHVAVREICFTAAKIMASLNWFRGSSKEAMDEMVKRNCAVLIYIGISLLASALIICARSNKQDDPYF